MDFDRFKIRRDRITPLDRGSVDIKISPSISSWYFRRGVPVNATMTKRMIVYRRRIERPLVERRARRGIGPSKVFGTNDRSQSARREACCTFRAFQASLCYRLCSLQRDPSTEACPKLTPMPSDLTLLYEPFNVD